MPLRLLFLLAFALLLVVPTHLRAADEDAAAAAQYARERLLREARRAIGPSPDRGGEKAIAAVKRSLEADLRFLMSYEPTDDPAEPAMLEGFEQTIAERFLLVGRPASGEGENAIPAEEGALQEARKLYGWLIGTWPCRVYVAAEGKPVEEGTAYPFPPEPEPEPVPEDGEAEAPAPEGEEAGETPETSEAPPAPAAPGLGPKPPGPLPEPGEPQPTEPPTAEPAARPSTPPPALIEDLDPDDWVVEVVLPAEQGTLRHKVVAPARCSHVSALEKAAASPPAFVHPDVGSLKRHALVAEDVFAYNAPYAALRRTQADQRNKAMQDDFPPSSFVDEGMVRQKSVLLERYTKQVELRHRQRQRVVDSLDAMVNDLDDWKTQAALLAQEIEEAKRGVGEPKAPVVPDGEGATDPDSAADIPETDLRLRLAQARESCVSLDVTLLYLTALRAEARLGQLDRLIRAANEEATAAAEVQTRYETALVRLRNERRLDRLYSDERRLKKWIGQLEGVDLEGQPPVYAQRLAACRAILSLNQVVQEAVQARRRVAARGTDVVEKPQAAAPATGNKGTGNKGTEEKADEEQAAKDSQLSKMLYDPESRTWDVKYVEVATRELQDPSFAEEFDSALVAQHYQAADERIRGLVALLKTAKEDERLATRFGEAMTEAQATLEPLEQDSWSMRGARLPLIVGSTRDDFVAAMDGIAEQRKHNQTRLEALLDYRRLLLRQGNRSLLIRTDRDLGEEDVRGALADTADAVEKATSWATLSGDDHVGTWFAGNWFRLLAFLAVLVGAVVAVHLGRRLIEARIQRAVETSPELTAAGASVKEEREEDRQRRAQEVEATVEVTEDEVLTQTAPDGDPEKKTPSEDGDGDADGDEDDDEGKRKEASS